MFFTLLELALVRTLSGRSQASWTNRCYPTQLRNQSGDRYVFSASIKLPHPNCACCGLSWRHFRHSQGILQHLPLPFSRNSCFDVF